MATKRRPTKTDEFEVRDVFIIKTDKQGRESVSQHRVWSMTRFLIALDIESRMGGTKWAIITKQQYNERM